MASAGAVAQAREEQEAAATRPSLRLSVWDLTGRICCEAASAQTRLLKSDQNYVYFFKQTPILSVFTSSEGSNSGPGGTDSERCLWAYLSTLFVITNCGFDPQFNNHDWTCRWFCMFMRGEKRKTYSLEMWLKNSFQGAHWEDHSLDFFSDS